MLPKNIRLKIADFNKNPQVPRKIYSNNFSLYIKDAFEEDLDEKNIKFVIGVPYSLSKRSTKRNYTRRAIKQVILANISKLKSKKDVLIRTKVLINRENRKRIGEELEGLLIHEFGR